MVNYRAKEKCSIIEINNSNLMRIFREDDVFENKKQRFAL